MESERSRTQQVSRRRYRNRRHLCLRLATPHLPSLLHNSRYPYITLPTDHANIQWAMPAAGGTPEKTYARTLDHYRTGSG